MQATGVLTLDLSWLNANLQKALAQQAWQASAHRLRLLHAHQRYTVLVCCLRHTYHETIDQLVDMYQGLQEQSPENLRSAGSPRKPC
jgi:hypothetical protein